MDVKFFHTTIWKINLNSLLHRIKTFSKSAFLLWRFSIRYICTLRSYGLRQKPFSGWKEVNELFGRQVGTGFSMFSVIKWFDCLKIFAHFLPSKARTNSLWRCSELPHYRLCLLWSSPPSSCLWTWTWNLKSSESTKYSWTQMSHWT